MILIAIPGYIALFTWLVLGYRAEMRTTRDAYAEKTSKPNSRKH